MRLRLRKTDLDTDGSSTAEATERATRDGTGRAKSLPGGDGGSSIRFAPLFISLYSRLGRLLRKADGGPKEPPPPEAPERATPDESDRARLELDGDGGSSIPFAPLFISLSSKMGRLLRKADGGPKEPSPAEAPERATPDESEQAKSEPDGDGRYSSIPFAPLFISLYSRVSRLRGQAPKEVDEANPESTEGGRRVSVLRRQEGAPVLLG